MTLPEVDVDLHALRPLFAYDDGLLPDINFNFSGARVIADAYARIQRRARALSPAGACYWSKQRQTICPIEFGDNPAEHLLTGECDAFHVVFTGLRSAEGIAIPDLGVFVLDADYLSLDYRMGSQWSAAAIGGLLDLMEEIAALSPHTIVSHERNLRDPHGEILMSAFNQWRMARRRTRVKPGSEERPNVLVVEDEQLIGLFIQDALETAGFNVALTATAGEARQKLYPDMTAFQAAVIDVGLPDEPGDVLAREIRALQSNFPIVIASGRPESEFAALLTRDPKVLAITKPYDAPVLVSALATVDVHPREESHSH
jgi:CheY-like chemotaxis protein